MHARKPTVIIVLPAYNAEKTLEKTVKDIPKDIVDEIILVDDGSNDETIKLATSLGLTVIAHEKNKGYGGNQKTCYRATLERGADIVVMLHPDYQYDPKLIPHLVNFIAEGRFDLMLGSRIRNRREALAGGMPAYKYYSNRFLSAIENAATGQNLSEWHTGMRAYSRAFLETIDFEHNSDDFVFDTQVLFQAVKHKFRIGELPAPVRYFPEASSINFIRSSKYGLQTLCIAFRHWGTRILVRPIQIARKLIFFISHKYSPYAILCAIGLALYAKSLFFGFSYLDDNALILEHLPYLEDIRNFFDTFRHGVFAGVQNASLYYRPILTISFMIEAIIGGSIPFFYHLGNITIHLIAAYLVYSVFNKLQSVKRISFISALIFLVHPVMTQAVSWIPGRNDSLLAVFILASFLFLLKYLDENKIRMFLWSIVFFTLAIFTKETAIVFPALGAAYLWIAGKFKRSILGVFGLGWAAIILIWFVLRSSAITYWLSITTSDMVRSLISNVPATIQMFGKIFFPFNLSVLPILKDTTFFWGFIALALMFCITIYTCQGSTSTQRSKYMMLFGIVWFLVFLLPSFIRPDISGTADFLEHRLYLPLFGILIFVAECCIGKCLNGAISNKCLKWWLVVVILFTAITFVHQDVYATRLTFWQNAASHSPHSSLAQKNLGAMYYLDQNYSLAEDYTKKALALNPKEEMAHNNLGLVYASRGETANAEKEYFAEFLINPNYAAAHYNLGLLYYQTKNFDGARKEWEQTLALDPSYADARRAIQVLNIEGK